uniref:Guanylate cyclase n=1 Tax=Culicoides sonorensis TaxID=179676 RepID=A0A336MP66_CULSO
MKGWISDPQRTAMVFEYCSRGSLQDVLIMDEIKLDWSFRLSLLTDVVRGMRYLHSSPIRVHGALSSRNCVVDARWVLKITDYGLPAFYEAQGLSMPVKSAKELLWTAPEALRGTKNYPKYGTQPADVYSFGIIMQEVVVRGEPYCMLSLSPDEIIAKIKKPPPLIRPSVSKGAAPPEAINIMRQCWAENPEMRPDFVTVCERFKQLNQGRKVNFVDTMFQMLEKYSNNLEELIRERTEQLEIERKKTEQLLNRMLPISVAEKLKMGLAVDPEEFSDVTIYFSDIVGFTTIAAHCTAVQVVDLLNDLYTCFDATINAYNVYKVETIGDAYMVVSGLPLPIADHSEQIATMALDLLHQSGNFKVRHLPGVPLQLRIGLHTGPCCAGVVGLTMPRYCLFGDTVNTASRMESTGSSWRIHMSQEVCDRLEEAGGYIIEPRGPIEIKGKGVMNTYWLLGKEGFNKTLPTPPPIGLDESLIRNSILMKSSESNRLSVHTNSSNPSSSHSPSVTGEQIDVKVEITPPPPVTQAPEIEVPPNMPKSYSNESTSTLSVTTSEYQIKSNTPSPQQRKYSEIGEYSNLLSAVGNITRLNPSPTGSTASTRFFKRIEEMIDLSSPYNHYKCLSPSETNLSQFIDARTSAFTHHRSDSMRPGSGRLLRRQFSLDKDDAAALQQSHRARQEANRAAAQNAQRMMKQHSISTAQDLEKIEENPISPQNSQNNHHNNSNGNNDSNSILKTKEKTRGDNIKSMSLNANDSSLGSENKNDVNLNVERLAIR